MAKNNNNIEINFNKVSTGKGKALKHKVYGLLLKAPTRYRDYVKFSTDGSDKPDLSSVQNIDFELYVLTENSPPKLVYTFPDVMNNYWVTKHPKVPANLSNTFINAYLGSSFYRRAHSEWSSTVFNMERTVEVDWNYYIYHFYKDSKGWSQETVDKLQNDLGLFFALGKIWVKENGGYKIDFILSTHSFILHDIGAVDDESTYFTFGIGSVDTIVQIDSSDGVIYEETITPYMEQIYNVLGGTSSLQFNTNSNVYSTSLATPATNRLNLSVIEPGIITSQFLGGFSINNGVKTEFPFPQRFYNRTSDSEHIEDNGSIQIKENCVVNYNDKLHNIYIMIGSLILLSEGYRNKSLNYWVTDKINVYVEFDRYVRRTYEDGFNATGNNNNNMSITVDGKYLLKAVPEDPDDISNINDFQPSFIFTSEIINNLTYEQGVLMYSLYFKLIDSTDISIWQNFSFERYQKQITTNSGLRPISIIAPRIFNNDYFYYITEDYDSIPDMYCYVSGIYPEPEPNQDKNRLKTYLPNYKGSSLNFYAIDCIYHAMIRSEEITYTVNGLVGFTNGYITFDLYSIDLSKNSDFLYKWLDYAIDNNIGDYAPDTNVINVGNVKETMSKIIPNILQPIPLKLKIFDNVANDTEHYTILLDIDYFE